jgi:hypothetical protein
VPADARTEAQISATIKAAQGKIGEENGTIGGALSQAKEMLNTANGYA